MPPSGKGPLRIALEDFLETFGIGKRILKWLKAAAEEIDAEVGGEIRPLLERMLAGDAAAAEELLKEISGSPAQGIERLATYVLFAWASLQMITVGGLAPHSRVLGYKLDDNVRSWRPDPNFLQQMYWRNPELGKTLQALRGDLGMAPLLAEYLGETLRPRAPEGTLLAALFRGILTEDEIREELLKRGYTSEDIATIFSTAPIIPGVQDLIRFAVREAFTPDIVRRFGYDQDFPEEILEHTKRIGLSDDWVRRYWYAHWELPSTQLGFEMLHRLRPGTTNNPFTAEDMERLLRTADIPEFFRKRIIEVSYVPFTRVDVRRMYHAGVLTQEQVFQSYLDIGYNEERAQALTAWTVLESKSAQKDITRAAIQKAYKQRRFDASTSLDALRRLGYDADEAQFWLDEVDFALAEELEDETIERAELLYTEGMIQTSEIYDLLGPLNLPAQQIALLIERWDIQLFRKIALPSRSELDDFYKRGVIDAERYREGLRQRRYQLETAMLYEQSLDWEVQQDALKEAERAQKEQERLQGATEVTEYLLRKAALDIEIAELRVQLAEIKLALHDVKEVARQTELKRLSDAIRVEIQEVQLQKAQLRRESI